MRLTVEARTASAGWLNIAPPLIAIASTILLSAVLLSSLGLSAASALYFLYIAPFTSLFNFGEIILKMAPLLLLAQALAIGFRAQVWNIGGEGQIILGAIGGSLLPIWFNGSTNFMMLPAMAAMGAVFGMAWAAIPALLKAKLNANEILVSLMLNSIALQLLYYLVAGPLRDPFGFNFPQSALFPAVANLPILVEGTRMNASIFIALGATLLAWLYADRSYPGFRLRVGGLAPHAADYAGFSAKRAIWVSMLIGGCAAGLVGVFEVAGPLGQLQQVVTPGYGYAAIIVAFLGGLNAWGILGASFFMALIFVGGNIAQTSAGVPASVNTVLQGSLLVSYIAARVLTDYKVRVLRPGEA